jgi:predicted alpha/beta-fold hydrolase
MNFFRNTSKKSKLFYSSVLGLGLTSFYFNFINNKVRLTYQKTKKNKSLINQIDRLRNTAYISTILLPSAFLEIIYGNIFEKPSTLEYFREIIYSPDKENLALDWGTLKDNGKDSINKDPSAVVVFLPGLTGSSTANYIRYTVENFQKKGFQTVVFNPRGVELQQVTDLVYDFREIKNDLMISMKHIRNRYPGKRVYFVGFSFGTTYGTQFVVENPQISQGMVSIANPFNLKKAVGSLENFGTWIYG